MEFNDISDREYAVIRELLYSHTGISLGPGKKTLVISRLFKRLQAYELSSFGEYFAALKAERFPGELELAIDLLTTNETYFFREPHHFDLLKKLAEGSPKTSSFRVWSAACSSGEEAYSIGIMLQEIRRMSFKLDWEVRASDISQQMLEQANSGLYDIERSETIQEDLLKRYFLKGTGRYEGLMLVARTLRDNIQFARINLIQPLPELVPFDVIFLRNVLIYFDTLTKRRVVGQILTKLKPDGVLFVGSAESLGGVIPGLVNIGPGVYRQDRRK